ncbi:MAG: twitching motility protein PilT [Hydrogenophilales bacterium 16-64-46]|nr:MAG: twitching motility protein PilT [Hydrogenophilales bacterium 12-64-13]OYZ06526.1 MAG: twitching motility protein PilT [Hydrogenophilales bacterium 16-64-46]OZA39234.1 MAG: twitching motility protein PilT [Hydrogenophilales bacterium 17-64-34]HQS98785.1 type II toxin-antitoxin system VapC family toxin [Thiobacillus sp.]
MRLLLDTHALIWWDKSPQLLPPNVLTAMRQPSSEIFFSAASVWEAQIKIALGKLDLRQPLPLLVEGQINNGLELLPIQLPHIWTLADLPRLHGDPFDRLLIAQARHEGLTLVSADAVMRGYPVEVLWA